MNFRGWTLFLDRDGVINRKIEGGYVLNLEMFEFIEGSVDAIVELSKIFKRIVVVTNQRGVGRGLMSLKDLEEIHNYMTLEIEKANGKIDGVFFCPHDYEKEACHCRKPNVGLALQAKEVFPDIDFSKSIVVGDSISDMEFARRIGAIGVAVGTGDAHLNSPLRCKNLWEFTSKLRGSSELGHAVSNFRFMI